MKGSHDVARESPSLYSYNTTNSSSVDSATGQEGVWGHHQTVTDHKEPSESYSTLTSLRGNGHCSEGALRMDHIRFQQLGVGQDGRRQTHTQTRTIHYVVDGLGEGWFYSWSAAKLLCLLFEACT